MTFITHTYMLPLLHTVIFMISNGLTWIFATVCGDFLHAGCRESPGVAPMCAKTCNWQRPRVPSPSFGPSTAPRSQHRNIPPADITPATSRRRHHAADITPTTSRRRHHADDVAPANITPPTSRRQHHAANITPPPPRPVPHIAYHLSRNSRCVPRAPSPRRRIQD